MNTSDFFEPGEATKAHQRAALLAELRVKPVSTTHARETLGIMSPAARVLELRRSGLNILTVRRRVVDSSGVAHSQAEYHLCTGGAA